MSRLIWLLDKKRVNERKKEREIEKEGEKGRERERKRENYYYWFSSRREIDTLDCIF